MLTRARRKLVANAVAHPDCAGVAVVRGRLGADFLRHHPRAVGIHSALFGWIRSAVRRFAQAMGQRASRAGQRDRPVDDAAGDFLPLGTTQADQGTHQYALRFAYKFEKVAAPCEDSAEFRRVRWLQFWSKTSAARSATSSPSIA